MSGQQRAAVALYALAPEDRELILAELQPHEQDQLRGQLREMQELGFERGAMPMLEQVRSARPGQADELLHAGAPALFALLEHEPAALVADVLALRAWPCRDALLAMFAAPRRSAISIAVAAAKEVAPARRQWLEQELLRRLAAAGHAPRAPAAAWRGWLQKATAWKR
jgi:hypothetical protein